VAARRDERERMERDLALAWMTAAYSRQPKLQPLGAILAKQRRAAEGRATRAEGASTRELAGALAVLAAQTGYPLRHHPAPRAS
jgi:hypothetical protein